MAVVLCPKCEKPLEEPSIFEEDDDPQLIAMWHARQEDCIYVACDDITCEALKEPRTVGELTDAVKHWKTHHVDCGCSHGS